jgi:hypothetical protein
MRTNFLRHGLAMAALAAGLGFGSAQAAVGRPTPTETFGIGTTATPVAMCGYSCRSGGRYIPGPPSVCYEEGLRYCGSSRDWGDRPRERRRFDRGDDREIIIERRRYDRY